LPSYKMVDLSIVVLGLFSRGYVICWMSWKQKHAERQREWWIKIIQPEWWWIKILFNY
jgi:phage baseplate assembly protein gpV